MKVYTTKQDAIEQAIIPAIGEDHANEYDLDAIFDACFRWHDETDSGGNVDLNRCGFLLAADEHGFWGAVMDAEYDLFTAVMLGTGGYISIEGDEMVCIDTVFIPDNEEWEPDVYDDEMLKAGWVRVDDWLYHGWSYMCAVRRVEG